MDALALPCPVSVITWFIPMVSPTSRPTMMLYGICMCWWPPPMIQMSCKLCWSFLYRHVFHLAWNNIQVMYYSLIQLATARTLRFFHPSILLRSFRLHWPNIKVTVFCEKVILKISFLFSCKIYKQGNVHDNFVVLAHVYHVTSIKKHRILWFWHISCNTANMQFWHTYNKH